MTHTLRFHCGFEREDVAFWNGSTGGTVEKTITSWSRVARRWSLSGGTGNLFFLGEGMSVGGKWVDNNVNRHGVAAFHLYLVSLPTSTNRLYMWRQSDATITRASISINSSGQVEMRAEGAPGAVDTTSTGVLETGKWYVCTVFATSSSFRFIARLRDTGATVVDVSRSTASNATRYCNVGAYFASYGEFILDNFVWESDATVGNVDDPVQLMSVKYTINQQLPRGAGYYTGGTGSWQDVDEVPQDGDTTYQNIDSQQFTHILTSIATFPVAVGTIHAVMGLAYSRNNACTGTSNVRVLMRSGSTDYDTGDGYCSTTYVNPKSFRTTDPATSAAWTASAVDGLQVGCIEAGTNAQGYVTAVSTEVLYTTETILRIPKISYAVDAGHALQRMLDLRTGDVPDLAEVVEDAWSVIERIGLPTSESYESYIDRDDLLYHEEVTYTQAIGQMPSLDIAPSTFNFVEAMVGRLSEPTAGI